MEVRKDLSRPIVISFSGLDGSGKTTQVALLQEAIANLGMRSQLITFWNDVVVGTRYREGFVHKVLGSERGVGEPGRPVERRDKNVRAGYLTLMRHLLYLADAIHLRIVLSRARRGDAQVIIMDRYIYDELANLPLKNRFSVAYAKLLALIATRPALAILLDTDPVSARARKPEYSVSFMHISRQSYYRLAEILGCLTVIPPLALEDIQRSILSGFLRIIKQQEERNLDKSVPAA
ncbi:MAG: thymidylate kinase [Acidobacteria bacterium]|nr:MAG: thymidylate kinase [Acidobacteriota bacterium]